MYGIGNERGLGGRETLPVPESVQIPHRGAVRSGALRAAGGREDGVPREARLDGDVAPLGLGAPPDFLVGHRCGRGQHGQT